MSTLAIKNTLKRNLPVIFWYCAAGLAIGSTLSLTEDAINAMDKSCPHGGAPSFSFAINPYFTPQTIDFFESCPRRFPKSQPQKAPLQKTDGGPSR